MISTMSCPKGYKHSPEAIEKIRQSSIGRVFTKERCEKIRLSKIGKKRPPLTKEWKEKISLSHRGEKAYQWKGGKSLHNGYLMVTVPHHPFTDSRSRIYEHRLVVEKFLGRYLKRKESVHHRDENKTNNVPENLMAFASENAHQRYHINPSLVKPHEIIWYFVATN